MRRPFPDVRLRKETMFFASSPLRQADRFTHPAQRFIEEALFAMNHKGIQVTNNQDDVTIVLDLPGIAKEHLEISVDGPVVRITTQEGAPRQHRSAYELPEAIDAEKTTAKMENGVLTLVLARLVPSDKSVKINIA